MKSEIMSNILPDITHRQHNTLRLLINNSELKGLKCPPGEKLTVIHLRSEKRLSTLTIII